MAIFTPKAWKNDEIGGTKLNAESLIDMEQRLSAFTVESTNSVESQINVINLGTDWSTGDLVLESATAVGNVGIKMDMRHGTSAAPITGDGSTIHLSKVSKVTQADHDSWPGVSVGGQTTEQAVLSISHLGEEGTEVQVQAANFFARNKGVGGQADACAIRSSAWQTGVGDGVAIGGYFRARSDIAEGRITGIEVQAQNKTGSFVEASNAGFTKVSGVLISAGSSFYEGGGAGIQFHHPAGWPQLDVGIHATSNNGGPLKSAFLRDNSEAAISLDIRGKHAKGALRILKEAGSLIVGGEELTSTTTQLVEILAGAESRNPLFKTSAGGNFNEVWANTNSSGSLNMGIVGIAGSLMTGTAAGDGALYLGTAKILHLGRSGAAADIKVGGGVGFFGTAPQAKPEVTGSRGGNAALASLLEKLAALGMITNGSTA